jgi:hypothetical protein
MAHFYFLFFCMEWLRKCYLLKSGMLPRQSKRIFLLKSLFFTFEETSFLENNKTAFGSNFFFYNIKPKNLMKEYLIFIGNMSHF